MIRVSMKFLDESRPGKSFPSTVCYTRMNYDIIIIIIMCRMFKLVKKKKGHNARLHILKSYHARACAIPTP